MQPIELILRQRNRLDSRACRTRELRSLRREMRETLQLTRKWQADIREDATACVVSTLASGAAALGGYQLVATFAGLWGAAVAFAIASRIARIRIALQRAAEIDRNITNMQASLVQSQCGYTLLTEHKLG